MAKKRERIRAKVTVGHYPDGKPIVKYAQGYTKKELAANVEELRRTYINGAVVVRRDVTFGEYAIEWYETYKEGSIGESSKRKYQTVLTKHILPVLGAYQMRAITAMDLQRFMNTFAGRSLGTIGAIYGVIRNTFEHAAAQGIIDRNPAGALKKPEASKPVKRRAFTKAETEAVLKLIQTHPDKLLLALLYYTGMRRGEALGLQWGDIDFDARQFHVRRDIDATTDEVGELKTAYSDRLIPIPDALMEVLRPARKVGSVYIVESRNGTYWHLTTFSKHWEQITVDLYKADPSIESRELTRVKYSRSLERQESAARGSVLTAHYFRHNYASVLYNAGVDVMTAQAYLGHADSATTMRVYTHLSDARKKTGAELVQRAFSGNLLATFDSKTNDG